jgi:hypothetical protein
MVKIKVLITFVFLFLPLASLCAATSIEDYNNKLVKHKVRKSDKIIIIKSSFKYKYRFKLLEDRILYYKNRYYHLDNKLLALLKASNTPSWKILEVFLKTDFIRKSYFELSRYERIYIHTRAEKLIHNAVKDFNTSCRDNNDARKKITTTYRKLIPGFITEAVEYKKASNKKLMFLSLVLGISLAGNTNTISHDASSDRGLISIGLRASRYLGHPHNKANFGFAFQVSYMNVFDLTKEENSFSASVKYIDFIPLLIFKAHGRSKSHNMHFSAGPSVSFRLAGLKNYTKIYPLETYTYNVKSFTYGIICELGYMYISKCLKFNFFTNLFVRIDRPNFTKYLNGVEKKTKNHLFIGMHAGIGFNLM